MGLSRVLYCTLLLAVGLGRLLEMGISARHQRWLALRGVSKVPERGFRWMVLLHAGVLVSAGIEVLAFHRPFLPLLGLVAGLLFLLANVLRWWVMVTMAEHWNVRVMASTGLGVVTSGPFRWIRHPNYVAVFVELLSLPLIHTAWLTALWGGIAHVWVLRRRVLLEEKILLADPVYQATMARKPRFIPRMWPGKGSVLVAQPRRPAATRREA